jgi:importin subunit alpha-2
LQLLRKGIAAENRQVAAIIEVIVSAGVVEVLERLLQTRRTDMIVESLWCLINLTSTNGLCTKVATQRLVTSILGLMRSDNLDIVENCIWIIGNIAGEGPDMINFLQSLGSLQELLSIGLRFIEFPINVQCMLVWSIGNHCRCECSLSKNQLFEAALLLKDISRPNHESILLETSWALHHITGIKNGVQAVAQAGFLPHLVSLLGHSNGHIVNAALRAVGSVVVDGADADVQVMIKAGFLQEMERLAGPAYVWLHHELLWILSNLALASFDILQTLIKTNLVKFALDQASISNEVNQLEISFFLLSVFTGSVDLDFAWKVYDLHVLEAMRALLYGCTNSRIVVNVLAALDGLMQIGKGKSDPNPVAVYWEELGGIRLLEELQEFPCAEVYSRTVEVMDKHYGLEETNESVEIPRVPGRFEFS